MKKVILKNGIKVIYKNIPGSITSFTIGLEAGANAETEKELGLAHVVEHMVFKGTKTKTEKEINQLCDEVFGFHNAMTNYPYVVYYGTCLSEDFASAFQIYSDIIINPAFRQEGYKEEIQVIIEELKEWSEDLSQHCEDLLFFNAFSKRRIKDLIIGRESILRSFTLEDVKGFYNRLYTPNNTVISVVTSLAYEEVIKQIEEIFDSWREMGKSFDEDDNTSEFYEVIEKIPGGKDIEKSKEKQIKPLYENPTEDTYLEKSSNLSGAKIQYIFPIQHLTQEEVTLLRVFNEAFGEGTSCLLYDEIRTNRGLVYDISGKIKNEKGIKLYTITLGTSKENVELALSLINEKLSEIRETKGLFTEEKVRRLVKSQKLKRTLNLEKSIVMAMNLAVYEIMYNNCETLLQEFDYEVLPKEEEILQVAKKVLVNPTIQIVMAE